MILVNTPEIGTLGNKQVASLAGLAPPLTHARMCCGAKHVTKLGKMARKGANTGWASKLAQCHLHASARRDPVPSGSESQVRSSGSRWEREKVAITAVMRRLLILANALLRDQRK